MNAVVLRLLWAWLIGACPFCGRARLTKRDGVFYPHPFPCPDHPIWATFSDENAQRSPSGNTELSR